MTEEGKKALKASWTPERRAAQAMRMRARMRKRKGKPLGKRRAKAKSAPRRSPGALGPSGEAIIYLRQACDALQARYRAGERVDEDLDPLIFLALRALTRRPK